MVFTFWTVWRVPNHGESGVIIYLFCHFKESHFFRFDLVSCPSNCNSIDLLSDRAHYQHINGKMIRNPNLHRNKQNALQKYERDLYETNQFLKKKVKLMEQSHALQIQEMKRKQSNLESKAIKLGSSLKKFSMSMIALLPSIRLLITCSPFRWSKDWGKCTKHCSTNTIDYWKNIVFYWNQYITNKGIQ